MCQKTCYIYVSISLCTLLCISTINYLNLSISFNRILKSSNNANRVPKKNFLTWLTTLSIIHLFRCYHFQVVKLQGKVFSMTFPTVSQKRGCRQTRCPNSLIFQTLLFCILIITDLIFLFIILITIIWSEFWMNIASQRDAFRNLIRSIITNYLQFWKCNNSHEPLIFHCYSIFNILLSLREIFIFAKCYERNYLSWCYY